MELALVLIVMCLVDTVALVWLLAKVSDYLRRLSVVEREVDSLGAVAGSQASKPVAASPLDLSALLADVSPDEIAKANAMLERYGSGD